MGTREHPTPTDEEPYRDVADLTWLTNGLRRLKLLGPPKPPPPEQLALFDAPRARCTSRILGQSAPPVDPQAEIETSVGARLLVTAAALLYIWTFARWTMRHHDGLGTQAFDLGLYDQGLWLLSRFETPNVTLMGRNLFGDHTSFMLLPLVPFYWVWASAKVLLCAQAAAIGFSAVPVFLLAREKLRDELLAAVLGATFLVQPALGWINLEQFHPDVLEIPVILFAAWFMVKERWAPFLLCVGALLLVKEDTFLLTTVLGAYVAVKHNRRVGLLTCGVSIAYAATAFWFILPALNGVGTLNAWRIPFGGPFGLIGRTLTHPGEVASYLFVRDRMWYLWQLFTPVAFLALAAPEVLLIGIAALGANLVSTFLYQYDIHYHYSTMVVPAIMIATIFGIARVGRTVPLRRAAVAAVATASVVTGHLWGPTPIGRHEFVPSDPRTPQAVAVRRAAAMIPEDAILSAYYGWVPQVDHRKYIYMFPNPWKASYWGTFKQEGQRLPFADRVDWVLVPTALDPEPKTVFEGMKHDFETVYEEDGVLLMRRRVG